jgi:hypothetical protein
LLASYQKKKVEHHENDISAQQYQEKADPRLSGTYVDQGRAERTEETARQRAQTPHSLAFPHSRAAEIRTAMAEDFFDGSS